MAPTIASLDKGQAVIIERIEHLKNTQTENHKQNRGSIHAANGKLERIENEIWLLKIKVAGYAGLGSTVATLIFEGVKYWAGHK
jgi:hypothetical protein